MQNPLTQISAICVIASCAGFAVGAAEKPMSSASWSGTVTHVTDGDTLWVRPASGGKPVRIRIDGVDAPEICQPYGIAARKALAARLVNQAVTVQSTRRDNFGRLLAHVSTHSSVLKGVNARPGANANANGIAKRNFKAAGDVGEWLVREGHAWSYRYRRDSGPYAKQQAAAQAGRKGLFSSSRPQKPREFRKQHGECADSAGK